jgi:hypothetical protein
MRTAAGVSEVSQRRRKPVEWSRIQNRPMNQAERRWNKGTHREVSEPTAPAPATQFLGSDEVSKEE